MRKWLIIRKLYLNIRKRIANIRKLRKFLIEENEFPILKTFLYIKKENRENTFGCSMSNPENHDYIGKSICLNK